MRHRFDRVSDQVDNDLLYLDLVDHHFRKLRSDAQLDFDPDVPDADQRERARLPYQLINWLHPLLTFILCDKITQPRG